MPRHSQHIAHVQAGVQHTSCEDIVGVVYKSHLHDGVSMGKEAPMAVAKVEAPDLDILVCSAADQQGAVGGDVHAQDWQLVTVQRQEELEGVGEEDFDGGVQQGYC